jgi:heptosyltransferase-2
MKFPAAFIALIASPVNIEVMEHNRYVSEVINYDKADFLRRGWIKLGAAWSFIRKLRARKFDVAIVPSTVSMSFTSDLLAYLSGAGTRIGAESIDGRENPSGFFFNVPVNLDWRAEPHRHQTLRNLDIAGPLALAASNLSTEITLTSSEISVGKSLVENVKQGKSLAVGFHPGAGKILNRWLAERFAAVANELSRHYGAKVFVIKGPMDEHPVRMLLDKLSVSCEVIENKSIRQVASILSHLNLVIANDTGIMHVAGAVGLPVLSLFGPTDPEQWAPIDDPNRYIVGKDQSIDSITVEQVVSAASEMLRLYSTAPV